MKKSCQIVVSTLATLVVASSFNCSSIAIVIITYKSEFLILASSFVLITNASHLVSIAIIDNLSDYITISIINVYETQLFLFFASNASDLVSIENSLTIILLNISPTWYTFLIEWAKRIYIELNINFLNNKIEDNFINLFDIDVSYVNNYSMLIICFFESITIFDCNIDLFK